MEKADTDSEKREEELNKKTLFGRIALGKRWLNENQLQESLGMQREMKSLGLMPKRIGEICVEKEFLSEEKRAEVLAVQKKLRWKSIVKGYEILEKLGRGSTGEVYKAWQRSLDRVVAVKILAPELAKNMSYVERFIREARAVARLSHENIISSIDVGESGGVRYFVMEYVDGITVTELLRRGGALEPFRSLRIVYQVSRALEHAQKYGLVHRDVKPDNIMIDFRGVAKLCDLGLAKVIEQEDYHREGGRTLGTPNYMSPEQIRGEEDIDIRSDIYSLGATFFHMITGKIPFDGPNAMVIMAKHLKERVPNMREINPNIPPRMSHTIEKMMAKDKKERFQGPSELLGTLKILLKDTS